MLLLYCSKKDSVYDILKMIYQMGICYDIKHNLVHDFTKIKIFTYRMINRNRQ